MRFALVTRDSRFEFLSALFFKSRPMANPLLRSNLSPRGNPAVLGNESVRPEALRPRLSASLPLERFDNPLRSGDKSSGLVAFSRHLIWRQVAVCREFEVMSYGSMRGVNRCQVIG
jgi:hypothetical protein